MKTIRWSVQSRRDLANIDNYYRSRNPAAADRLGNAVIAAAKIVQGHPLAGPMALDGVRRKWRVKGTPYSLFYAVRPGSLLILRVLHHAQDQRRH